MRVLPVPNFIATLRYMGAVPTPLPFGEIYTALQTGVVDGFEHDAPTCLAGKFYEVAKNCALTQHIYNPHAPEQALGDIVSLTIIGPDVLEADRFATGAFAMGADGIQFIERQAGLEGYAIDAAGIATMTSGFGAFVRS